MQVTVTDVAEVAPRGVPAHAELSESLQPEYTAEVLGGDDRESGAEGVQHCLGAEVATLFEGTAEAGRYYVATFDAAGLASGIYFYRLVTEQKTDVQKMMLVR